MGVDTAIGREIACLSWSDLGQHAYIAFKPKDVQDLSMTKLPIAAVERDTGLSKDLLRAWERRYGFPLPERDAAGERLYPLDQVERLRTIRRLVDSGHRPGKVVGLPMDELRRLSEVPGALAQPGGSAVRRTGRTAGRVPPPAVDPGTDPGDPDFAPLLELVRALRSDELRSALAQAAWRMGLEAFVTRLCAPLTRCVGEAWARGEIEVYEEHLYTEAIQSVLRGAIAGLSVPEGRPRALLATFPLELHGLGLLMVEALLALEGCRCISLGTQVPVVDIARAATAQPVDIVALSFSPCLPAGQVAGGLAELRNMLPRSVDIWAGGSSPVLLRKPPEGIVVVGELTELRGRLQAWRAARAA